MHPAKDERVLVCEGPCNPDLKEYDEQLVEFGAGRSNKAFIAEWARRLRHTEHLRITDNKWGSTHGWYRVFRCQICGATRRF